MKYRARAKSGTARGADNNSRMGKIFHAVDSDYYPDYCKSLCGVYPTGKSNGWTPADWNKEITCPKCIERINNEQEQMDRS